MKKILALLLALVMCFGILAACAGDDDVAPPPPPAPPGTDGGSEGTGSDPAPSDSERAKKAEDYGLPYNASMDAWDEITFTYFSRNPDTPPAPTNPIIAIIEEITNTKIDFHFLVGDLETALGVMLASGDLHDMIFSGGEAAAVIDSGHVIPLEDLISDHAPNLRAHYNPWWDLMRHTDGHIYTAEIYSTPVGTQNQMEHWGTAFWIQKDVLDHFGRAPADLDEFFDMLGEYKELNPTIDGVPTLAYEIMTDGWRRFSIDNPGMFMAGHANWGGAVNTPGNNFGDGYGASDRWVHDWNKDYYKKLNEEFLKGTFTAETLTRSHDEYLAAIATGAVLAMSDQLWSFNSGADPLRAEGRWERTYLPLDFTWPGAEPNYLDSRQFTGSNGINVSTNNPNPIRTVQYMDYLIQEDVQRFIRWGIEGENWFYNADGRIERPQEQRELQQEARWLTDNLGEMLWDLFPKMQGSYSDGNPTDPGESTLEYFAALNDYDRALFAKLGIETQTGLMRSVAKQRPVHYPFWSMSMEDGSPEQLADQRLNDVRVDFLARLVIAPEGTFDDLWDEYAAAINAIDQQPIFDFFDRESARRAAAFGG